MRRNRLSLGMGLAILLLFAAFSLFPSAFSPCELKQMDMPWLAPSLSHPLGTNDMGYDIFTELVHASRITLGIGLLAALISLGVGTLVGLLAGYMPGWAGEAMGGVIQIFLMIPLLPMAILVASYAGADDGSILLLIALLGWCGTARTVRARTVQLKQTPFVESLILLGISKWRILTRHILPNLYEVALSRYIMSVGQCMMLEATLSFLGLGDPTQVTWGRMIHLAYRRGGFTRGAYNWLVAPGACIALIVIAFYLINHALEARSERVASGQSYLD